MNMDEFPHERQPDAAALDGASSGAGHASESIEYMRKFGGRNASAGIANADFRALSVLRTPSLDCYGAIEGEFECIRQQIENHFFPHVAVDVNRLGQRLAIDREPQACSLDGRTEVRGQFRGKGGKFDGLKVGLRAAGFDAREIQQGIDQLQQPYAVAMGHPYQFAMFAQGVNIRPAQDILERTEHQGKRGTKLVTDVGKKSGFRTIEFCQGLRAALGLLVRLGVGESGRDLSCDQIDESQIGIVHAAKRIDPGDQKARRRLASLLSDRRDDGFTRRPVPGSHRQGVKAILEVAQIQRRAARQNLVRRPSGVRILRIDARGRNGMT